MALSEREQAFENKFKHDEQLKFRISSRRAKLFGLWVAEQMGLSGQDADEYAREVVTADMDEPGSDDMIRKVTADLERKNVEISAHRLQSKVDELLERATREIMQDQG